MAPTDTDVAPVVGKPNPRNNSTIFKIFQNVQYNVVQHKKYVKEIIKLYKKCPAYRLIIVEGLCRLIYLGHLESPVILSRLILLWFNPATVEEDVLRQTIGIFFQTFPSSVDGAQEQIQEAMIPLLRSLCCAPASSPLSDVDQEAVVRFMVSLTRVSHEVRK